MSESCNWDEYEIPDLEDKGVVYLGRGNIISKIDIQEKPGGYPIYSSSAKGDGMFGKYGDYMFDEEMITWSIDGGGALFYRPKHKFSVTNVCGYMRLDTSILDYRFIHAALCLQHSRITFDYQTKAHPSVIRNLYKIPIPPLPEQKKIAEILSGIDKLIHAEERKISKIVATKIEMSRDMFSSFVSTERQRGSHARDDIAIMPLESVCESVIDCKNRTPPYTEGGHPVIRTPNVRNGKLVETDLRYTDPSSYKIWTARAVPRPMDVLFTREAPLGEVCLVPENFKCCLGQRMMLFRADKSLIDPQYLLFSLMSPFVQDQLLKSKGGTTVGHARVADIRNLPIPVFPKEKQVKIATAFSSIEACLERIVRKKRKLEFHKTAIASDLLSGRKRVSV